jgi:hypothetical protein
MTTLSPAIRGGPLLALLAAAFAVAPATAGNDVSHHRYSIMGSLTPSTQSTPVSGGGLQLTSHLGSTQTEVPVQAGGGLALIAKMAYAPTVCYGDTIFRDGFDP